MSGNMDKQLQLNQAAAWDEKDNVNVAPKEAKQAWPKLGGLTCSRRSDACLFRSVEAVPRGLASEYSRFFGRNIVCGSIRGRRFPSRCIHQRRRS